MSWKLLKAICASGWSGLTYLVTGVPKDKAGVFNDGWGLFSTEMEIHWARVENDPSYHNWKNITTEWCRAKAQPASKLLCAITLIGWLGWLCWLGFGIYLLSSFLLAL